MRFKNKPKILFLLSFIALITLPFLLITLNGLIQTNKPNQAIDINKYLKTLPYDNSDPYVTKVPNLKNLIDGPIISKNDPTIGSDKVPITIVQFSDFACQFCQTQFQTLKKVIASYGDKIKLIRKDYPETNVNSASYQSAIAARCAQAQNKFWEFHDLLYETNKKLNKELFIQLAKKTNLNQNNFINCLDNPTNEKILIKNNILEANALGINGVPFLYINKQKITGNIDRVNLEKIIKKQLD